MTTLNLQPSAAAGLDTFIDAGGVQSWNYGVTTTIQTAGPASTKRGLIKFDLSSIPGGSTITSATLTLVCTTYSGSSQNVAVHRALTQWFEGSKNGATPDAATDGSSWTYRNANGPVNWGTAGGQSGTDYTAGATDTKAITATGSYNWDVTADVQGIVDETYTNHGWWLIQASGGTNAFGSSDNATAGNRPQLVVEYTEPTTWSATIAGTSTVTADFTGQAVLGANLAGTGSVAASLTAPVSLESAIDGSANVSGTLDLATPLSALIAGSGGITANLEAVRLPKPRSFFYTPLLYLTDGSVKTNGQLNKFDLLAKTNGVCLTAWRPAVAQYKDGGYYNDSALATGRRLVMRRLQNIYEVMEFNLKAPTEDIAIAYLVELQDWLERAADYWESSWVTQPIYLVCRTSREAYERYALVQTGSLPDLPDPYNSPFRTDNNEKVVLLGMTLKLEHGLWQNLAPGESEAVSISSERSWTINGWQEV